MPTPFYHLDIAAELLRHSQLDRPTHQILNEWQCAFLLGSTAPDVQVVSGQPREATHFFRVPPRRAAKPPWKQMLAAYPQLSITQDLPPGQAAFIAGYLCHLLADWDWINQIYLPYFGFTVGWGSHSERLYLHNVLRAYLEDQVMKPLSSSQWTCFHQLHAPDWLPFTAREHLQEWSSFLAQQLHPDGRVQTVEVFAERQGLPPDEFYSLLLSEERMENEVFIHFPRKLLAEYRKNLVQASVSLLNRYLAPGSAGF